MTDTPLFGVDGEAGLLGQGEVDGLRDTLRMMRSLPKEAQKELRAEVQRVTDGHAAVIRSAMGGWPDRRVQALSSSVRAAKDRTPVVNIGTARRLPLEGNPRGLDVLYGAEFGANVTGRNAWRFPARTPKLGRGNVGYTIFPALRDRQPQIARDWESAVLRTVRAWSN